ncbi:MAG: glycosyltransferase family 39 protein [Myxococcota bacterium]
MGAALDLADARDARRWAAASLGVGALILCGGLGAYGIWDPWELDAAELARNPEGPLGAPPLAGWLVGASLGLFGVHEWAGRLPGALAGLAALATTFVLARRVTDAKGAAYAVAIAVSTPLLVLHSRHMFGQAPMLAATALLGWTTAELAFQAPRGRRLALLLAGFALGYGLALLSGGALLAVVPPLLAATLVRGLRGSLPAGADRLPALVVGVTGVVTLLLVVQAIAGDAGAYDAWRGGTPRGGQPPSFDHGLELFFHAAAPFSALALLAMVRLLGPVAATAQETDDDGALRARRETRLFLVLWPAFAYGAWTVFVSRYGAATFSGLVPVAVAVATLCRDVEESDRPWWPELVVVGLLAVLVVRDYALFPDSPLRGLDLEGLSVPDKEVFNPAGIWAALMGFVLLALTLGFGSRPGTPFAWPPVRAFLREQWARGGGHRAWVSLLALLSGGTLLAGLAAFVAPTAMGLTTFGVRLLRALFFLTPAALIVVALIPNALALGGRLGRHRLAPLVLGGVLFGAYTAFGFQPALSQHLSPRLVYDRYNELRAPEATLLEYRAGGRASAYYAEGEVEAVKTSGELLGKLQGDERAWAIVPTDELASLDRTFRKRRREHLWVADARSATLTLVTNEPVEGRENENFLTEVVLQELPELEHEVGGVFDGKIELAGYDLDLPQEGYIGAGQRFAITWYWRVRQRVSGSYKIFLHVDGAGNRMNGDHDPAGDRYPVRFWEPGDIIVDRQELTVPANYRPGTYTFWIGLYAGQNRLDVTEGEKDDANRLAAGRLEVR